MTGMSDSMRTDFRVIKCIAEHTRLVPKTRVEVNIPSANFNSYGLNAQMSQRNSFNP